ncbi:MAG: ABC transporter ATP-binding protein [candidate division WOR-3 bacterium]
MEEKIIEVEKISKNFGNIKALDDVSFYLRKGEILCILGENGSGKSTLINIIAGIIKPLKGNIRIFGKDPFKERDVYSKIGFLFHEPLFYPELTLYENLYIIARIIGIEKPFKKIEKISSEFLIEHKLNEKVKNLSRGEIQKAGFIRAFLNEPEILVLDEPFTAIDENGRKIIIKKFLEFKNNKRSIIFSTHEKEIAEELSDRILILSKGKRIFFGNKFERKIFLSL